MNRMNTLLNPENARGEGMTDAPASDVTRRGVGFEDASSAGSSLGGGTRVNVSSTERDWSTLAGLALAGVGLYRRTWGGFALAGVGTALVYRGVTGHCSTYAALGVDTAKQERPDPSTLYDKGVKIAQSVTVLKPAEELYNYWRDLGNLPKFMPHVKQVETRGDGMSHWTVKTAGGLNWSFDAEVINDEAGRLIAWRTVGGVDVHHAGSVRFVDAPPGRGTEVRVNIEYLPPAGFVGKFGAKVMRIVGQAPKNDVRDSLRKFKQLMEAGEIPTVEGQPMGQSC